MQQRTEILKMLYREQRSPDLRRADRGSDAQEIDELMKIMKNLAKEGKSNPLHHP